MPAAIPRLTLEQLRREVAKIDPVSSLERKGSLRLGIPVIDTALQGGLAFGALHELAPAGPFQLGASLGFACALAVLAAADGREVLCIETDFAMLEGGAPYRHGLDHAGLSLDRFLILRVTHPRDALWAFEEALRCPALAAILAELPEDGAAADPVATRRLALAAQTHGGLGLLLRQRATPMPTAAMTRWQVAAALSEPDGFGGLGRTRLDLSLNRNRRGRCGRFIVSWNHDERSFLPQALSLGMAETACDRSDRTPLRHIA